MAISKVTLNGVTQMDVTQKTVTADKMLNGITSLKNDGTDIVGNIAQKTSSDVTVSGATVTVPAGSYASSVTKSVASGTAGTPTATKGTVSNHSVSITPSVTNTTGFITGSTKTGTAVSVSASELVSGTLVINSSGTKDVTNYASASIAAGTEGTPTASKGTVAGNQVTVTPSVTNSAGYISGGTKTGTGVTVSASELVSGSQTITESGTYNVTNLASIVVDIPSEGEYYMGVDLTEKFASEITSSGGDPWAWIKSRITSGDYSGLRVGDYIPFTCTNTASTQLNARILGFNTYTNYGSGTKVGNHIDFFAGLWPTAHAINTVRYNNGTSSQNHPWLASDAYLYANSLSGNVPNATTADPATTSKNYTSDGIYYYLPTALKNVIVTKRAYIEKRYSSGTLLTEANGGGWADIGKMWLPDEIEVYGTTHWSKSGYATLGFIHYPFFKTAENRTIGGNQSWYLLSAGINNSTYWCFVSAYGSADTYYVNSSYRLPVCFRVA